MRKYSPEDIGKWLQLFREQASYVRLQDLRHSALVSIAQRVREETGRLPPDPRSIARWSERDTEGVESRRRRSISILLGSTWKQRFTRSGVLFTLVSTIVIANSVLDFFGNVGLSKAEVGRAINSINASLGSTHGGVNEEAVRSWVAEEDARAVKDYIDNGDPAILGGLIDGYTTRVAVQLRELSAPVVELLHSLATISLNVGHKDTALRAAETALRWDPSNKRIMSLQLFLLGSVRDSKAQELAGQLLARARVHKQSDPEWYAQVLVDAGAVFEGSGSIQRAMELWREVISDEGLPVPWKSRAPAYLNYLRVRLRDPNQNTLELLGMSEDLLGMASEANDDEYTLHAMSRRAQVIMCAGPGRVVGLVVCEKRIESVEDGLERIESDIQGAQLLSESLGLQEESGLLITMAKAYEKWGRSEDAAAAFESAYVVAERGSSERFRAGLANGAFLLSRGESQKCLGVLEAIEPGWGRMGETAKGTFLALKGEALVAEGETSSGVDCLVGAGEIFRDSGQQALADKAFGKAFGFAKGESEKERVRERMPK